FRRQLAEVRDLERTIGRLSIGSGNARDLLALRQALEQIPALKGVLSSLLIANAGRTTLREESQKLLHSDDSATPAHAVQVPTMLAELAAHLNEQPALVEIIARAVVNEPPLAVKEGGMIREGFDPALDDLRRATREGKDWIAKLQQD